jgi:23S rRNA (uracil1939-C5)-methyltransferase
VANELHELRLDALTYGGEAVGRLPNGRAVFVPFALPGELVRVQIVQNSARFARARLLEVVQASEARIAPRCKHFGTCGGCHYQHMRYESQVAAKSEILRDQLKRIGGFGDPPMLAAVPSPNAWNYRNQIQFHVTPAGKLAYVSANAVDERQLIAIDECHLPERAINSTWPQLNIEGGAGVGRVAIRSGNPGQLMLIIESSTAAMPELEVEAGVSVAHIYAEDCINLAGEDHITVGVGDADFRVSATSFFQVNTAMVELMVEHLLRSIPSRLDTAIDAYCGVGLFSRFLAERCKRLIAIESSTAACEDFAINLDAFGNVELYEDLVEKALPALQVTPELVLVDPPRLGLPPAALDAIVRLQPARVIYVSCDPATLSRDAARLARGGYRLSQVEAFDLFPQTYHIESIAVFDK